MAINYRMTWIETQRRWVKKVPVELRQIAGVTFVSVSPRQLGTAPTKAASWRAANQWWDSQLASWREQSKPQPIEPGSPQAIQTMLEAWAGKALDSEDERALVTLDLVNHYDQMPGGIQRAIDRTILGDRVEAIQKNCIKLSRFAGDQSATTNPKQMPLVDHLERFLSTINSKPGTVDNIRRNTADFVAFVGDDQLAEDVSGDSLEEYYLSIKVDVDSGNLTASTANDRIAAARRFVRYLWQRDLIELPKNLDSRQYAFRKHNVVKLPTLESAKAFIGQMSGELRLYALLMLNCSMNNIDIGELTHSQIDWKNGYLTRKRVKTAGHQNVPTVKFKLWSETLELLKLYRSSHPELVLVSRNGTELVIRNKDGKQSRKDNIFQIWKRKVGTEITPKTLRSLGSSTLESHENYGRMSRYYLCHSPRGVADRHYIVPPQNLFDQAIDWLGSEFGIAK